MKVIKRLVVIAGIMLLIFLLADISLYANAGEVVEDGTWLSRQLEIYGVPAGISTVIGVGIGYGLYFLVSRGSRKTMGLVTGLFSKSTDKLELANNNAIKLVNEVKNGNEIVVKEVKELKEASLKMFNEAKETLEIAKTALVEVNAIKDELKNGMLKIIKSLKNGLEVENEENKEKNSPTSNV